MLLHDFSFLLLGASALYGASVPTLAVDATASQHPISPLIYGINEFTANGVCCSPFNEWTDSGISVFDDDGLRRHAGVVRSVVGAARAFVARHGRIGAQRARA